MDKTEIEAYLYQHIPLSAAMQCRIELLAPDKVVMSAPLAPNINHRQTAFGGSVSTLATLAAWTLVHTGLRRDGIMARVVIQRHCMSYDKPVTDDFQAVCELTGQAQWRRFTHMLQAKGRGRISLDAAVLCQGEQAGGFSGDFVAIKM